MNALRLGSWLMAMTALRQERIMQTLGNYDILRSSIVRYLRNVTNLVFIIILDKYSGKGSLPRRLGKSDAGQ